MTSQLLSAIVACVLLAGACADDNDPGVDPAESTSTVLATTSPAEPQPEGEWVTMSLQAIAAVGESYFAMGDIVGIPAIWRSADLEHFEMVYLDDRDAGADRWMRLESIVDFGGRIVVGGAGQALDGRGERVDRSFLFVSDDQGDTWQEVDDPLFGEPFQRLDRLVVGGDTLLVDLVNDECCEQPAWQPHRTTDLVGWKPVDIADGPSSYAYGRVLRVAEDVIEFSIEDTDIVVTLTPRVGEPDYVCG